MNAEVWEQAAQTTAAAVQASVRPKRGLAKARQIRAEMIGSLPVDPEAPIYERLRREATA